MDIVQNLQILYIWSAGKVLPKKGITLNLFLDLALKAGFSVFVL